MTTLARQRTTIARPLKTLVPLIKEELEAGNRAGLEHYRRAGAMLLEARDQMTHGTWGGWLAKHFALSSASAYRYMKLAELRAENSHEREIPTLSSVHAWHEQNKGHKPPWYEPVRKIVTERVNVDSLTQEPQARSDEVKLHRDLALQLIDIGYKALATRLHPDKGGSRDAMARLNRVRDELKDVATTRRFV